MVLGASWTFSCSAGRNWTRGSVVFFVLSASSPPGGLRTLRLCVRASFVRAVSKINASPTTWWHQTIRKPSLEAAGYISEWPDSGRQPKLTDVTAQKNVSNPVRFTDAELKFSVVVAKSCSQHLVQALTGTLLTTKLIWIKCFMCQKLMRQQHLGWSL